MAKYKKPNERVNPSDFGLPENIIDAVEVPPFRIAAITDSEESDTLFDYLAESLRGKQHRDWFVQHAYHCLPLTIANQTGFIVKALYTFQVLWNGGDQPDDVSILPILTPEEMREGVTRKQLVNAHFGMGTVTIQNKWHYRTPQNINLLTINPPNQFIDGICHMSGMIETDNLRRDFTFNLKITRPGVPIRIEKGSAIGCFIPYPRHFFDQFELASAKHYLAPDVIDDERSAAILAGYERDQIDAKYPGGNGYRYMDGEDVFGNRFSDHQKSLDSPQEAQAHWRSVQPKSSSTTEIIHLKQVVPPIVCEMLCNLWEKLQSQTSDESERNPFFDRRVLHYEDILTQNPSSAAYMQLTSEIIRSRIMAHFGCEEIWADDVQIVKWWQGHRMFPHADKENPDGEPHATPWRDYASVAYLNEDYDGGELEFPNQQFEFKPAVGDVVCFRGDLIHLHGVTEVTSGNRYTMPSWYTGDKSKRSAVLYREVAE